MEEEGYGSVIGTAVLVLALLFSISAMISLLENTYDEIKTARAGRNDRTIDEVQTDVEIENVVYDNSTDNLVVRVRNTGSTVLVTSKTDLFVDGWLVREENILKRTVDGSENTDVWLPEENLTLITTHPTRPRRIKVVTEGGVSDYVTSI